MSDFDYDKVFSRNIGWISEAEQSALRRKRIAIAGMGGVGGFHLLALARLGIGNFNIADLDVFEIENFNRQVGASMSSIGRAKVDILTGMTLDINPQIDLKLFSQGIDANNLDDFFRGVDLYVDGLDFFAFEAREKAFAYCAAHGIPAVTVAPLGISAALLNFLPGRMTFEEYFQIAGCQELGKAVRFLVGLAPALLHRHYLADKSRVSLQEKRGPSTIMACQFCAGVAASEAFKILIQRGMVWATPHGIQYDGYRNRFAHTWRPGGNRNPINRFAIAIAKKQLGIS